MSKERTEDHLQRQQVQPLRDSEEKEEDKELDLGTEAPLPLAVTSRLVFMLGDIMTGPAHGFSQWLELVRKRSGRYPSSGFPHRLHRIHDAMPQSGTEASTIDSESTLSPEQLPEISLWERLGKAAMLNIESSSFSWAMLSSLHHIEHNSSTEHSEDEMNKALEGEVANFSRCSVYSLDEQLDIGCGWALLADGYLMLLIVRNKMVRISKVEQFSHGLVNFTVTVNSGGVVFFGLFNLPNVGDALPKEAVAVIKISSSRMATQSERLGYEFAKLLGIQTPQARVIHNSSLEWLQIKEAAEKAKMTAISEGDEIGEVTCAELLEALELSRCLLLMSYVHGSPLLESSTAFESREAAEKTAAALGRVLMLDLVIRNEDRLPCRQLRWRGNPANLLCADKMASTGADALEEAFDSAVQRYRPRVLRALQKERRATSVDSRLSAHNSALISQTSDLSDITESPKSGNMSQKSGMSNESTSSAFHIVAIDSGVPRRPPQGKRANDQANYPKLVELLLNSYEYASNLLHEMSGSRLGSPPFCDGGNVDEMCLAEFASVVHEFRNGFRAALRNLQGFHIFLLALHQKLDSLSRSFFNIINKTSLGDSDKEDLVVPESPSAAAGVPSSSPNKERGGTPHHVDLSDSELQRTAPRSSSGNKESSDSSSPLLRENWHGKFCKGSGEPFRGLRLTAKLRDFHKYAKVDADTSKDLEQWNEILKNDAVKLCQENNFNTGFFEGNDNNSVIDAYELKVRLEHILERIALISEAANTERPSSITSSLFIGGALAARSVFTLQHLDITHVLCLCSNEIGQSDSQYPDLFKYKNFSISDDEETNISSIFAEACEFIDHVEQIGGKVLVHCFEGKSRSATMVIAYLMLRKNFTLLEAWNILKRAHRRAQPNDGFARILLDLDRKLHGKVSMEWQQRKPVMKVCSICGKNAGLSSSSLKLHLQKSHKKLSSGSVDSAMTMEIQKALTALRISRSGSVSPTSRRSHAVMDDE